MLGEAVTHLVCPHCGGRLRPAHGALACARGHSYDIARQGYVNLLHPGTRVGSADTSAMVASRESFLAAGHFAGMRVAIVDVAAAAVGTRPGCVVDVGAGTGYYLAGVLDRLPDRVGLALDLSKPALRRAARAHHRIAAVACDAWGALPLADGCATLVLDVFAPRNPAEFQRILTGDGALLVVTPTPRHLHELVEPLGLLTVDERKPRRLAESLTPAFTPAGSRRHEEQVPLGPKEVAALVEMGPSARHIEPRVLTDRIRRLFDDPQGFASSTRTPASNEERKAVVTISVDIGLYRRV